jgi:dTDP-L-rhamnose 4-epimerase
MTIIGTTFASSTAALSVPMWSVTEAAKAKEKGREGAMCQRVLVTGGAGFIGSHLADELLRHGYEVRVLDSLSPQVHPGGEVSTDLDPDVELKVGDVRDETAMADALQDVDAVVHLAAAVGVGQSMYEIVHYTSVNNLGTATLLEALARHPVARLVVASSMSIYGEGAYRDSGGELHDVPQRSLAQLRRGDWEIRSDAGQLLEPVPTPETKWPDASSVYALSKHDQERLCLIVGQAYGIKTTALRLFNVYGPRQALSNPYTGVMAIFASRFLNGVPPLIYEDGCQRRDFVNVHDVATAFRLALESPAVGDQVLNVGSGTSVTISEIAEQMARTLGCTDIEPRVTAKYRAGDIRHCFGDITKARHLLGFEPQVSFEDGLAELAAWLEGQAASDRVDLACNELLEKGLLV